MPTPTDDDGALALALDRAHVFHSWSAQATRAPLAIAGGRARGLGQRGTRYLDFSSQLVNTNIGHQHPRGRRGDPGAGRRCCRPSRRRTRTEPAAEAARGSLDHAPDGIAKVFFTNGGADANENAIRMARLHTGREKVLSAYRSYHGNTGAAIVVTGDWRRWPRTSTPAATCTSSARTRTDSEF